VLRDWIKDHFGSPPIEPTERVPAGKFLAGLNVDVRGPRSDDFLFGGCNDVTVTRIVLLNGHEVWYVQ
jgi:hypothetical protein